jgi:hypothetical protein
MTSRQKGDTYKNVSNRIRLPHTRGAQVNEHRK